jgi:hypothetical protein
MADESCDTDYLIRRSSGGSFRKVIDAHEAALPDLATLGYRPISQVWGWDTTSSAGWLFGGSSWKPGFGTLVMTHWRTDQR